MFAHARSIRSWWRAFAAVLVAAIASPTLAQPSVGEFTELTLARLAKIERDTSAGLMASSAEAVETIEHLDLIGKPNRTIYHYYLEVQRGMRSVAGNAQRYATRVETTAIATLTRMQAPAAVIAEVRAAATSTRIGIAVSHEEALEAVKRAAIIAMR